MRIHIATDHAGLEFSRELQDHLRAAGHEVVDHGPRSFDPVDDYPSFCIDAAIATVADRTAGVEALGVVFGGSGNGEQMAANKVRGARAALVWSDATAVPAREHNDANVISIGARQHPVEEAKRLGDPFLAAPFRRGERPAPPVAQPAGDETTRAIPRHPPPPPPAPSSAPS